MRMWGRPSLSGTPHCPNGRNKFFCCLWLLRARPPCQLAC
jgi:hypothetical protein